MARNLVLLVLSTYFLMVGSLSPCDRKIRRVSVMMNRKFKHLSDSIGFEKDEHAEMEETFNDEIHDLRGKIGILDSKVNKTATDTSPAKYLTGYLDNIKSGLNAEKRKSRQFERSLKALKALLDAGGVNTTLALIASEQDSKLNAGLERSLSEMQRNLTSRLTYMETLITDLDRQFSRYRGKVDRNEIVLDRYEREFRKFSASLDLQTGKMESTIQRLERLNDDGPCSKKNGGCMHSCRIGRNNRVDCSCNDGWELRPDRKSCRRVYDAMRAAKAVVGKSLRKKLSHFLKL